MKRLEILLETGALAGKRFAVPAAGLRLGRSSQNDISIPDGELSRLHCKFDPSGESGVTVVDLASANGTFVNGEAIGAAALELKEGDRLTVGATELRVVSGDAQPEAVQKAAPKAAPEDAPTRGSALKTAVKAESAGLAFDLGFGKKSVAGVEPSVAPVPRDPRKVLALRLVLAALGIVVVALAAWVFLTPADEAGGAGRAAAGGPVAPVAEAAERTQVVEMHFEKVDATVESVFRYAVDLSADGVLSVTVDDVPRDSRHVTKSMQLGDDAREKLVEILGDGELAKLGRDYQGPEGDGGSYRTRTLSVVFGSRVQQIAVVNTEEPEAFRSVRMRLESLVQTELGIWAIQFSREKLVELAGVAAETGRVKWEDRDVEYGNLFTSVKAYREALFYLETVNPKPAEAEDWREAMENSEKELDTRWRDQRFKVDRAIGLKEWDKAREELRVLCEMVPDRTDARYREAREKLVEVERNASKEGKK